MYSQTRKKEKQQQQQQQQQQQKNNRQTGVNILFFPLQQLTVNRINLTPIHNGLCFKFSVSMSL